MPQQQARNTQRAILLVGSATNVNITITITNVWYGPESALAAPTCPYVTSEVWTVVRCSACLLGDVHYHLLPSCSNILTELKCVDDLCVAYQTFPSVCRLLRTALPVMITTCTPNMTRAITACAKALPLVWSST
jgi:hypothetical protein